MDRRRTTDEVDAAFAALVELVRGRRVVALTGAGCSTESGIPDYRGPETRSKARNPVQYRAFVSDPAARTRYWARSSVGYRRVATAQPNAGHEALARLERAGHVAGVITQNVDRLHHAAGSRRVVELHGALADVVCLACGAHEPRPLLQRRLKTLNPDWHARPAELAPDGDAELIGDSLDTFRVPGCRRCDGVLKPDVVFFGENVPKRRVETAWRLFDEAEVLLVAGSSLTVYSGYRFVRRAAKEGVPVAVVNLGPTRGDAETTVHVDAPTGTILPRLAEALIERAEAA